MVSLPTTPEEHREWWEENTSVPYGYCWCGCGQETSLAPQGLSSRFNVRGAPQRYVPCHSPRNARRGYKVEDNGYDTPCWTWQGCKNRSGYGHIKVNGRLKRAHRVHYEEANGPIPDGLQLDHLCRITSCVNPAHLEPVSPAENIRRAKSTKLIRSEVQRLRELYATGRYTYRQLADEYGLGQTTVYSAITCKSWKD